MTDAISIHGPTLDQHALITDDAIIYRLSPQKTKKKRNFETYHQEFSEVVRAAIGRFVLVGFSGGSAGWVLKGEF